MGIFALIKNDLAQPRLKDPAYNGALDLIFNYPGVWAVINHRFCHALWIRGFKACARVLSGISNALTRVDIHPGAIIGRGVFIDHATGVVIGQTAIVGDDCLIYQGVTLGGVSLKKTKRHPTLLNGVVVGAGAKILGDITIGQGCKIGANSVVTKSVPDFCTAVGSPARIIGECSQPLNNLPDIDKKLFAYLLARIDELENAINSNNAKNKSSYKIDDKLKEYLKSLKE